MKPLTRIQKIEADYAVCVKAKAEAAQLSNQALAEKFECCNKTIAMAIKGIRINPLTDADVDLIIECGEERDRLRSIVKNNNRLAIAIRYGVSTGWLVQHFRAGVVV